jgi:hypothetical protein
MKNTFTLIGEISSVSRVTLTDKKTKQEYTYTEVSISQNNFNDIIKVGMDHSNHDILEKAVGKYIAIPYIYMSTTSNNKYDETLTLFYPESEFQLYTTNPLGFFLSPSRTQESKGGMQ